MGGREGEREGKSFRTITNLKRFVCLSRDFSYQGSKTYSRNFWSMGEGNNFLLEL